MIDTCTIRRILPGLILMLVAGTADAEKLVMPKGMGGVPDIGAIPCSVFNNMMVIAPLGTRHSLLTWSAGYLGALSGKDLQGIVNSASAAGNSWTYDRLGSELVAWCAANPDAVTRDAAANLAEKLDIQAGKTPVPATP